MINGKLVKELREAQGLSQVALAKLVGVNRGTIYFIETERQNMKLGDFRRLCQVLGADPKRLLDLDENELLHQRDSVMRQQALNQVRQELTDKLMELAHA